MYGLPLDKEKKLDFFPALSDDVESRIESTYNSLIWLK
jgi:hypothetical protein